MPSATFDSNVYISALVFRKKALALLELAIDRGVDIAISDEIMDETLRVLHEKFKWNEARMLIDSFARHVTSTEKLDVVKADPNDNIIVECAAAAGSDYLVTGDHGILGLGSYEKTQIITPAEFMDILTGHGRSR